MFDHKVVETVQQLLVFQAALFDSHEKLLPAAGFLLCRRELQLQQIVADSTGEAFSGEIEVFVKFFVVQIQKSFGEGQYLVLIAVHIASAQFCDRAVRFVQSFFQFQNIFFCHNKSSFPVIFYHIFWKKSNRFFRKKVV